MASRHARRHRLRLLLALAALALVAMSAGAGSGARLAADPGPALARAQLSERITALEPERLARAAIEWRGGPITTSTGEVVNVRVSDALPIEQVTPEGWAEFLARVVHGPELARLDLYVAPLSEVRQVCGFGAIGCYRRDEAVAIGETLPDGTTPDEVVRHEYGHHIALYRENTPWRAIDWGPKRWASVAGVCARVKRNDAFPGNQGANYSRNPGEAWAEVYRLMDERKAGVGTARWQIIAPSFYPSEAALQAAEQDVVSPWTGPTRSVFRRSFTKRGQVWLIPLSTPLDGDLTITATLPRGGQHDIALVGANRRPVLARAVAVGARQRRIDAGVCGRRAMFIRITQKGALGQVSVTATTP